MARLALTNCPNLREVFVAPIAAAPGGGLRAEASSGGARRSGGGGGLSLGGCTGLAGEGRAALAGVVAV
jgi:hypothetical protein